MSLKKLEINNNLVKNRENTYLEFKKRHKDLILYKNYKTQEYPRYNNYNAINIDKTREILVDYDRVMGVPITFLDKYNLGRFEIIRNEYNLNTEKAWLY